MSHYGDQRKLFCSIMYGNNFGESFAKDLADNIKERFQISEVKVGWSTLEKDAFDTMCESMENSACSFFVYTEDMNENYGEWFEHATKFALGKKKMTCPTFVIIKPFTTDKLHKMNKWMSTYEPIEFDANYLKNQDKWERILASLREKANDWLRDHERVMKQDPEERDLLDQWRRFMQENWEVMCESALIGNIEDSLFAENLINVEILDRIKVPTLIKREKMALVLERVIRSPNSDTIKKFVKILEKKEIEVFKTMCKKMTDDVRCHYEGKSVKKSKKILTSTPAEKTEEKLSMEVDAAAEVKADGAAAAAAQRVGEDVFKPTDNVTPDPSRAAPVTQTNNQPDACHGCKKTYSPPNSKFCSGCGSERIKPQCKYCDVALTTGDVYCYNCGKKQ